MTDQNQNNSSGFDQKRRRLITGSAVAMGAAAFAPAAWKKPVVDKLIVPAHAQGSVGAGLYVFPIADGEDNILDQGSFVWPGGTGPETVELYVGTSASGEVLGENAEFILASIGSEFTGFEDVRSDNWTPAPPAGLVFFVRSEDLDAYEQAVAERFGL